MARKLGLIWSIDWVREDSFKNSVYQHMFAKPTELLGNQFNLDREILVLVSTYGTFEARSFDYVDKLMADYQNRLDKMCIIVVSNDPDIQRKIQERCSQDKEVRVVIPYTVSELLDPSNGEDFLLRRMRDFLFVRDLFEFTSPLKKETFFFGRSELLHNLHSRYLQGENSGLFGLRKIGKTSTLYALGRLMLLCEEPFALVQCDNPSFYLKRWNHALAYLVGNIS
ncbi:MAG: hypothetical protein ACM3WT_07500, partial [Bacillota bacterium]